MSATWLIEERILGTTLDIGRPPPTLAASEFLIRDNANLYALMLRCQSDMGACDTQIFGDWLMATNGHDLRSFLSALWEERIRDDPQTRLNNYVDALRRAHARVDLQDVLTNELPALRMDASTDPTELREQAIKALQSIVTQSPRQRTHAIKDVMRDVLEDIQRRFESDALPGVTTGFPRLDDLTGGWQAGDLTLLAARPAVGKTALALNFAISAARAGKRVGILSTEQPATQIAQRLIAIDGKLAAWKLRSPSRMTDDDWNLLTAGQIRVSALPIVVNDDPAPHVDKILTYSRVMNVDLLLIDYVQRIKAHGSSSYERVSAVALALKELARELEIPVVALAQINRAGVGNARMENLKGSGDLEQEADAVMILERPEDNPGSATLTIEKNRHGPTCRIDLVFDAPCLRFGEAETRQDDYGAF
jgi:replicative DNA helicase